MCCVCGGEVGGGGGGGGGDLGQQHTHVALASDITKLYNHYDVFLLCAPATTPHPWKHAPVSPLLLTRISTGVSLLLNA